MADTTPVVNISLDDLFQNTAAGPTSIAIANNLYGINHRQQPNAIPINKDNYGLTLFTRPQLNLFDDNIRNVRQFTPLMSTNNVGYQRIVRCTLDPRLAYGRGKYQPIDSPVVDSRQAFIPVLSNTLKSIAGWPDLSLPTATSKPGAYQEAHTMVDGIALNYTAYDLDATFRSTRGDLVMALLQYWQQYQAFVMEGLLLPYPDMITENEIDYQTRIYRLILDPSKTTVQAIGACGAAFPSSLPIGGKFSYSSDKPFNDTNSDINIRFSCVGFMYQDDILVHEFNKTVGIFNPSMRDAKRNSEMIQIRPNLLPLFNTRGYPHIDIDSYELEWYVSASEYASKINAIDQFNNALASS